jgi:hypothetical protein
MNEKPCQCVCNLVDVAVRMGRIQERLTSIMENYLFENISKHDPMWNSTDETECDRLHMIRGYVSCLHDNLWDLMGIIRENSREET